VLVSSAALGTVAQGLHGGRWFLLSGLIVALTFGLLFAGVFAGFRYRPAMLVRLPGEAGLAAAPNPAPVFAAAGYTMMAGALLTEKVGDMVTGEDPWILGVVLNAMLLLAVAVQWRMAWVLPGVRLRPDGIHDRQAAGSLFIPWDALDTTVAATALTTWQLALHYRQPELVRRRGWRLGGQRLGTGTDAGYLARAIQEYVSHPDRRPAIGTATELRRLTAALAR